MERLFAMLAILTACAFAGEPLRLECKDKDDGYEYSMDAVYLEGELIGKVYREKIFEEEMWCTDSTLTIKYAKIKDYVVNVPLAEGNAEGREKWTVKDGKCSIYTYFTFKVKISQERLQAARGKSKTDCITIDYD